MDRDIVHDVDTVLVGGRAVKRGGRLVGVDWPVLAEKLRRSSERILAASGRVDIAPIEAMAAGFMLAPNNRPMPVEVRWVFSCRTPAVKVSGMPAISVRNLPERNSAQVLSLIRRTLPTSSRTSNVPVKAVPQQL